MTGVVLESVLTRLQCDHAKEETMPTEGCQRFYECESCKTVLRPKAGDCRVVCSYGAHKCPPIQVGPSSYCSRSVVDTPMWFDAPQGWRRPSSGCDGRHVRCVVGGRVPAAQGRAVVLRIEPLRVSTLSGFHPSRNPARPAARAG